jgi:hypothetical protein
MNLVRSLFMAFVVAHGWPVWSQETESPSLATQLEKLRVQSEAELLAEMALLEIAIKSMETTRFVNDYAGGLDQLNVWISVPTVLLGGTELAVQGARLSDGLLSVMTPEKARWFAEYAELKVELQNAEKAYRKAARLGDPGAQDLHIRMLEAENTLTKKLLRRPGKLYKLGRTLRFVGRSSVVLAGVALTALSFNEALMLGIGRDQMDVYLRKFKERVTEIEMILNYRSRLPSASE